ncbi:response regulator transcription factor [Paraburkholderia lacunae]|uniref:Two-component system response regulator n=1 Tax=Paraburkholderia lacunae TaxID=2211104 RepID=A0A370MXK1_9BURK|nr:response regulator [Paraburkholderia lacunae]RDJ98064.1 two-component system response regulator [Paraburkholderia lacunae]
MAIVCIIDDDALIRKSLTSLLKSAGHTAVPFSSGEDFLASAQAGSAGCILLDLELKGVNGLEVQRLLLERGVDAPVIFISSHGDDASVGRALEQGARAFLHKPFSSEEILELIERLSPNPASGQGSGPDGGNA